MASIEQYLTTVISERQECSHIPYIDVETVVRHVMDRLAQERVLSDGSTSVWCDACSEPLAGCDVVFGRDGQEMCGDCAAQFIDEEE